MTKGFRLDWRGKQTEAAVIAGLIDGLSEIGLRVEAEAKKELYPGHGKVTGTLQRSIHTAEPGYNWRGDSGGMSGKAALKDGGVSIEVGSGLEYAMSVHQGHHGFTGYHYLVNAVDKVRPKALEIVTKAVKAKLK